MDRNKIVQLIVERLEKEKNNLAFSFVTREEDIPTRFFIVDNLLPDHIVQTAFQNFPRPAEMRRMKSFREHKYTTKDLNAFNPILKEITFALQDQKVIDLIGSITGFQSQTGDPQLYAGGLSLMTSGDFLNPHIDNSHNHTMDKYRTGNILYYITPDWDEKAGGNLELWDKYVKSKTTIHSKFNRLVFMETNQNSWHSVSPITAEGFRCCISNYYFSSMSPINKNYFNVTSFSGRPNQKVIRLISKLDNGIRQFIRNFKKEGFAQTDILKQ